MATREGAVVAGVGDRTGSLTPGKRADVIAIAGDTPAVAPVIDPIQAVVLAAHPGLVRTVIVDGQIVKREGRLTGPVAEAVQAAQASLDRLASTVPALAAANPHRPWLAGAASGGCHVR